MMTMARRSTMAVWGLIFVLGVAGCQDPDKLQIQAQAERILQLETENDNLRSRLAATISDRDVALERGRALEQQVFDLRQRLAEASQPVELPTGWQGTGDYAWIDIGTEFLFRQGYASLRSEGEAKLQAIVGQIRGSFPDKMIWVVGHTDSEPIKTKKHLYKDNLDLSLARGATVFRALLKLGIDSKQMIAGGQGEYSPKAPNDSPANMQLNRRVQIFAVPKPGQPVIGMSSPRSTPAASTASPAAAAPRTLIEK